MLAPITPDEEAAAVTTRDGFDFVFTTDTPTFGEDNDDGHIFRFRT